MAVFAYGLALLSAASSVLLLGRVKSLMGLALWMPKALAGSAAAFLAALGMLGAALGWLTRTRLAVITGGLGALLSVQHVRRVTAPHDGFAQAFGPDWRDRILPEQRARLIGRRWVGRLSAPKRVRWERDVPFWTMPDTGRVLLCDIWQPPAGVSPSGLALVYCHGGAWHWMDKDFSTRPFFRHMTAQGHVVMDVAYRLCPEVDLYGMVGDVKRAIVWMKGHAGQYGVDPGRVVVAGGSAGGHLALLAAYTPNHPELTPPDLNEADASVRAVVAYYAPADMRAVYQYFETTFGSLTDGLEPGRSHTLFKIIGAVTGLVMGDAAERAEQPGFSFDWLMVNLLGGSLDEVPHAYELASPMAHVSPDSPPTLLLQGAHDSFVPTHVTRNLHQRLKETGVPSVYVEFSATEHGFDLFLPRYAPAAQAALYDVDRFLALML